MNLIDREKLIQELNELKEPYGNNYALGVESIIDTIKNCEIVNLWHTEVPPTDGTYLCEVQTPYSTLFSVEEYYLGEWNTLLDKETVIAWQHIIKED